MPWDDLTMEEKSQVMKLGVSNGVTSLSGIKKFFDIASNTAAIETARKGNSVSDEQVVDAYLNNVVYSMENPTRKGYDSNTGTWKPYTDKDAKGNTHYNFGPGIESRSDIAKGLDYSGSTRYTTEELNSRLRKDLMKKMQGIRADLTKVNPTAADTMSIGNKAILLDIAHNVSPRGKKRANMPSAWPSLVNAMIEGNPEAAKTNMRSGNERRRAMREDLLYKKEITPTTVRNRANGGYIRYNKFDGNTEETQQMNTTRNILLPPSKTPPHAPILY